MPFKAFKRDSQWCVFKIDQNDEPIGSSRGCHNSRDDANSQIAAINIAEREGKEMSKETTIVEEKNISEHFVPTLSFEQLEELEEERQTTAIAHEINLEVHGLLDNIISLRPDNTMKFIRNVFDEAKERFANVLNGDSKAQPTKTERGVKFPASDFAFVPDPQKPSTWKLRLAEGKSRDITVAQLNKAVNGFSNKRVQIPSDVINAVKRRIKNEYRKLDVKMVDVPDSVKDIDVNSFMIYKDNDVYRFFARYSNNRKDQDIPPDIIASRSHERFVKMVDSGEVPLPELQLWHLPQWTLGETEVVAYDKETGVAMATGFFYKEAEPMARFIQEHSTEWGVSHGMKKDSVKRIQEDGQRIIVEHITEEISPLPLSAAANKWADFIIISKEVNMLSDKKRKDMLAKGVSPEMIDAVESMNKDLSQTLDTAGVEKKDVDEAPANEAEEVADAVVEPKADDAEKPAPEAEVVELEKVEEAEVEETAEVEVEPAEEAKGAFSQEQIGALAETFAAFGEELTKSVTEIVQAAVAPIQEKVNAQDKSHDDYIKEQIQNTPPMSLKDTILTGVVLQGQSATVSEQTLVDGRTKEAKDGPAIKEAQVNKIVSTGFTPFDDALNEILQPEKSA